MSPEIDLYKIEKKAWGMYCSQDGFYDMFIGIMLIISAIQAFYYNIWYTLTILIAVLIVPLGKKYITVPRIGFVKFGGDRQLKQMKLFAIIGIAVSLTFVMFLIPVFVEDPPRYLGSIFIGTLVATIFGAMAYYMNYPRLFIYGIMFAVGEIIWGIYGEPTGPLAMLVFGIIMVLVGLAALVQFMRRYPIPKEEVANEL